ncbi:polysaccharide deacetylase family protein [Pelotomaculum isophthalicicum JI]|uniref:Polysaccharide deacetylase family protein n=1 Tax=Pelotomaculum isophthalicicum JI TaxID=947010 RepID=A0A9X4H5Q1_9FIRM|nr:polysaccharide deacetylase family protein [Pelotomaculum isophthalicicum]MDF9407829.1 polysaccharide deacetylase family protein [Pelotomaculum isophthalicicum JI]
MRKGLIIAYHRVNSSGKDPMAVSVENFQAQMKYFHERGYSSLTLADYSNMINQNDLPKKSLVITFDDGYRDNYLFAFPTLKLYGFRATIFLTVDFIGTSDTFPMDKNKWDKINDEDLPLSWEQVLEMKKYGVEFGSHTCSHWHLDELPEKELIKELVDSKRCLEENLQSTVTSFCYPSGRFNQRVKEAVCQAGYLAAVVTPRLRQVDEDIYSLKRIGIYSNDTDWRFRLKTSPYFAAFRDSGLLYQLKNYIPRVILQP